MLTIFSTAKPFRGHINVIQRNAIRSWALLHRDIEIILFGDEEGVAEAAGEFGIRHEPEVRKNEHGTKRLDFIFDRAREISWHPLLCYLNCDMILMADFRDAIERVSFIHPKFLMIGQRWDTDITEACDFSQPDWEERLRALALSKGARRGPSWVDYFVFSRDLYYKKMPPFLIGRHGWDPWLTWYALANKVPLVDATPSVVAVHQNHDYSYLTEGGADNRTREEAFHNMRLARRSAKIWNTDLATEKLFPRGLCPNDFLWFVALKNRLGWACSETWFALLKVTRPIRHPLGIRKRTALLQK